jgi:pimeloyl-ACP methyl ester carboxylesterase
MDKINWLFLRGLTREKRHWGQFLHEFANQNPQDRVLCLDLPGFGTENQNLSPASVSAISDHIRERFLTHKESQPYSHTPKWAILGMSLGGMISLDWMARHKSDFDFGVLINTSASNLSLPLQRLKLDRLGDIVKTRFVSNPVEREKLILKMTTQNHSHLEKLAVEWAGFYKDRPYKTRNAFRQLLAASLFKAPEGIQKPLLFLGAAGDRFTDVSCTQNLAKYYDSTEILHPHAGHDMTTDDPVWVSEQVRNFRSRWVKSS